MAEAFDPREMNRSMVDRLDGAPAEPIAERGYALRVLRSTGRVSGEPKATPIGVLCLEGRLHLISPDGTRDWVRNVRAAERCELSAGGRSEAFRASEITGRDGAVAVRGYLEVVQVPWALRAFPVEATAEIAEIEDALGQMAVFRLAPVSN